ncbi:MAG: hypothetical protein ACXVEF_08965 [Polyangiales bacterium]
MARAAEATLLITLLAASTAHADDAVAISAQLGVESFKYAEEIPPPAKSEESALLPTFAIEARAMAPSPLFARAQFLMSFGSGTYDGSVINPTNGAVSPATSTTKHRMLQPEGDLGLRFVEGDYGFALFGGVGMRSWRRDLTASAGGYVEDYRWGYGVVGALFDWHVNRIDVELEGALLLGFSGGLTAHLDALDPRIADTDLAPKAKLGGRLRLPISYRVTDNHRVGLVFSYETSAFDQSPKTKLVSKTGETFQTPDGLVYTIFEPASSTRRIGIALTGSLVF